MCVCTYTHIKIFRKIQETNNNGNVQWCLINKKKYM